MNRYHNHNARSELINDPPRALRFLAATKVASLEDTEILKVVSEEKDNYIQVTTVDYIDNGVHLRVKYSHVVH